MTDIIDDIKNLKDAGQLGNYLEYVRFPKFKDLQEDTQINFTFPLTVLIGANGTRKSSVLKGLQGCPEGQTPEKLWFATKMDAITETASGKGQRKTSIVHAYKGAGGNIVECLKVRAAKVNRSEDYWETAKPTAVYNMGKERYKPINKNVEYLNFRAILPAFDKCFYFSGRGNGYIRNKSGILSNIFKLKNIVSVRGVAQNEVPQSFSKKELTALSGILGRKYIEGTILHHKIFDGWADTIRLKTDHHEYSEAFAGSGESAVAVMVHKIESAPDRSLIILDEPEVSLHPEAQKRLKEYLLKKIVTNKHQIVISTHSPFMVEGMPRAAIKAFRISPANGHTEVIEDLNALEAFSLVGHTIASSDKKVLWVEDTLGQEVLKVALSYEAQHVRHTFDVRIAGPNAQIFKSMAHACNKVETQNYFFICDGDVRSKLILPAGVEANENGTGRLTSVTDGNMNAVYLEGLIEGQSLNQSVNTLGLTANANSDAQKISAYRKYLEFSAGHLHYFPGDAFPEALIWDEQMAKDLLLAQAEDETEVNSFVQQLSQEPIKKRFDLLSQKLKGEDVKSNEIFAIQQSFVRKFFKVNGTQAQEIRTLLETISNGAIPVPGQQT